MQTDGRKGHRTGRILAAGLAFVAVSLAACSDSPSEPVPEFNWEASLEGSGIHEGISGTAVAVSSLQSFQVGVTLEGAEPEHSYAWWVATGTCDEPGDHLGAGESYPAIEIDEDGGGEAEATVTALLDPEEQHHVSVGIPAEDEAEIVACGTLELT